MQEQPARDEFEDCSPYPLHQVYFDPLEIFGDPRGWLAELWRADEISTLPGLPAGEVPQMAYLSFTEHEVVRGPHEHERQTDIFVFLSQFRVYLWDSRPLSPTRGKRYKFTTDAVSPTRLVVPPHVVHAYQALSLEGGTVLNFPTSLYRGIDRKGPVDEIRHEEDPDSPYVLW